MTINRRAFLRRFTSYMLAAAVSPYTGGCAINGNTNLRPQIDLTPRPGPAIDIEDRRDRPRYRSPISSSFRGHLQLGAYNTGGIDYAPVPSQEETEICPVGEGRVITAWTYPVSGMVLRIAHGLGWKSGYSHLKGRFVGYRKWVFRSDVIALMGDSGWGGRRSGMEIESEDHLHLTLYGPAYAPLFKGVELQLFSARDLLWRNVLDPEEFSLTGRSTYLPFQRDPDSQHDHQLLAKNADAIEFCDRLLDLLADEASAKTKERDQWEKETSFAYRVDQRILFLWERLHSGRHPFNASETQEYRAKLVDFMTTVPRLTAPIVEPSRRASYTTVRRTSVLYKDERSFGGASAPR